MNTWTTEQARQHRTMAKIAFDHSHRATERDELTLANCGACALTGYGARNGTPNHSDWRRLYVEAGVPVPDVFMTAFRLEEDDAKNNAHREALERSLNTFGCPNRRQHRLATVCQICGFHVGG